jgi:hypothetical protein
MRLKDVVNQFRLVLPKYTDRFSSTLEVSSIVAAANTATITTVTPHNMETGHNVTVSSLESRTPINSVSKDGLIYTFISEEHDLTFNDPEHLYAKFEGFTDPLWNRDDFKITAVQNRKTFSIRSTNPLPVLTDNEFLLEKRIDGIRGRYLINKVNDNVFTINGDFVDGIYRNGRLSPDVRITGMVDIDRLQELYTRNNIFDLWGYVIMHDVTTSKDRSTNSDATATIPNGTDMRLRLIDGFDFVIVVNTTRDISANDAIDLCRHELFLPILKTIYGVKFDTGLSDKTDFKAILIGQGMTLYQKAYYLHVYRFETQYDITNSDSVVPGDTRAFRDIGFTQKIGEQSMSVNIDLDDIPIIN